MNTDHNKDLQSKYGANALPTVVFLNSNGDVIHKFVGYKSYDAVMKEVQIAKSKL